MAVSGEIEHVRKARYYDMAERYADMAQEMKAVVEKCVKGGVEITVPYRNLLSMAYKNLIANRRSSWRILYTEKQKIDDKYPEDIECIDNILIKVQNELFDICSEVLMLIDQFVLPNSTNATDQYKVFFLKMKGDYHRYKAEVLTGAEEKEESDCALASYLEAKKYATKLLSTDPIRLGLFLNFSVFYFEILDDTETACEIAKSAFTAAITELDSLTEEYYKDSTLIMQFLKDNLTLWSTKSDTLPSGGNDDLNPTVNAG